MIEGIQRDALNHIRLISTINYNRSALIYIDSVDPAISLIVSLQIIPQRLILFIRNIILYFDDDKSSHRRDAVFRVLSSLLFRQALKAIALVRS